MLEKTCSTPYLQVPTIRQLEHVYINSATGGPWRSGGHSSDTLLPLPRPRPRSRYVFTRAAAPSHRLDAKNKKQQDVFGRAVGGANVSLGGGGERSDVSTGRVQRPRETERRVGFYRRQVSGGVFGVLVKCLRRLLRFVACAAIVVTIMFTGRSRLLLKRPVLSLLGCHRLLCWYFFEAHTTV